MPKAVPTHKPTRPAGMQVSRHRQYDRTRRDPESKAFYNSTAWVKLRAIKLRDEPMCERCLKRNVMRVATHVHHVREISECPELSLDLDNLQSLCPSCHSQHHASEPGRHT